MCILNEQKGQSDRVRRGRSALNEAQGELQMLMVTLQRERQHNRDAPAPAPPEMLVYVFYKNCFSKNAGVPQPKRNR